MLIQLLDCQLICIQQSDASSCWKFPQASLNQIHSNRQSVPVELSFIPRLPRVNYWFFSPPYLCFFLFFLELCSYFCFFSSIYFLMSPGDAMDACYIRYTHQKFRHFRSRFMSRAHFVEDLTLKPLQQQQQQQQQQQILRTVMITPKILVTSFLTDWEDLHSIFQQFDYLF